MEKRKGILITLAFILAVITVEGQPIKITREMVVNESGSGDCMKWFDEQNMSSTPTTRWATSGNTNCWPAGLVIDLGREYLIERVCLYDGEKSARVEGGRIEIGVGAPFEWTEAAVCQLDNRGEWREVPIGKRTRYLHLVKEATVKCNLEGEFPENCDLAVAEVVVIGKPVGKPQKAKKPHGKKPKAVTMDKFIGMNSYINTAEKLYEAVGSVREYRPWRWNGVPSVTDSISWEPMKVGDGDKYYAHMHELGIDCLPCIHRHVLNTSSEQIPSFGADPNIPETYRLMADYSFQFVARYGSRRIDERLLRTTEPSPKKSGLGYIRYFENWNEQNREWGDPMCHFTPYMFAAFSSASYDGHLKTMGPGIGVKTADPDMKYVMGGLAGLSLDYIQAMKLWSDYYRRGSFPADVLNVHHYCNTRGRQHPKEVAYGISPEEDGFKEKISKLVEWRDKNLPDKELWLTEIGWDTSTKSYQSAGKGHKLFPDHITMQEIQAQWLARAFLIGSAAGLDRMMMYLANDIEGYKASVYGDCGLITVDKQLKTSFYYLKTMRQALKGMVFDADLSAAVGITVLRYRNPKTGTTAYAVWSPTSDGTIVKDYQLKMPACKAHKVRVIEMRDKAENGITTMRPVSDKTVTLTVNETPLFVIVDK